MGKLKNVAGNKMILIYYLQKLADNKEYEIFKLETQASYLFFKKNLIERMRTSKAYKWEGMLAPPLSRQNHKIDAQAILSPVITRQVKPTTKTQSESISPKTSSALKAKVGAVIRSEAASKGYGDEEGVPFERILARIKDIPESRLRDILTEMGDSGMIYSARDNEFMSLN
ncbi:Replication protein A C-terminal domain-containing protein [Caenorhabditis elegans]|nr:Replication protein A C-terminal domain-containing protein [Caenorhabditis elegans]NP_001368496.1 Replication protein A C-terminal domain-containing protein [Caenorhabditis elegans]CCD63899.1 Replication protein A C-terminal domain-containing protein [Caenorhabditis elegans]CEN09415.1 Replication protein A C-terminal domain-containing protein [Caenorhabditis elegans]|eukprot:NP_001021521.1 Replication Protein A homolog [Caenorhabditis elegans]